MKIKFYLLALILLTGSGVLQAQVLLKGTVYDGSRGNRMSDVFVKDGTSKQITITDKSGKFEIKTETGHILIFSSPGYVSDTLYVTDMTPKKIEMQTKTISLREVSISSERITFDAHKEYPDVYTKSKVYPLSPSSWFSKEARDARRLKRYFAREEQERKVDEVFNRTYVGSIVPLKGMELENFMTLYRPSYAFITGNNSESLAVYINDSYKKYMALPPDKRQLQKLTSQ
jgi:hypothetical protein